MTRARPPHGGHQIEAFLEMMSAERGAAANTLAAYRRDLDDYAGYFLAWRLCLYGATIYGWLRMRRRLYRDAEARQRLFRAEIGAIAAITLLEVSVLLT